MAELFECDPDTIRHRRLDVDELPLDTHVAEHLGEGVDRVRRAEAKVLRKWQG